MRRLIVGMAIVAIAALVPCWANADDQAIAQSIEKTLKNYKSLGQLKDFSLKLDVDDGAVVLAGHVANQEQEELIVSVARTTSGVKHVLNELQIGSNPVPPPITAARPVQQASMLPVSVSKPVANNPAANRAAERVQPANPATEAPQTSDQQIAQQIGSLLEGQKQVGALRGFNIQLNVVAGEVRMDGRVADANQQKLALEIARRVRGVTRVVNQIAIAAPSADGVQVYNTSARVVGAQATAAPQQAVVAQYRAPVPFAQAVSYGQPVGGMAGAPAAPIQQASFGGIAGHHYDNPQLPGYAWPSYAPHPNYGALTYPRQYSPTAWPYIGPFYPYPQVPLGWRKVTLEWDDGWWFLDFKSRRH